VGAGVVAVRTAEGEVELPHRVGRRGVQTSEVVAHDLLADEVGLLSGSDVGRDIEVFGERACVLVLLVEAVAIGVESRGVEGPLLVETVGEHQLVVDLQVVVRLIVVIVYRGALPLAVLHIIIGVRSVRGVVHALGVEPPAVETHLLFRRARVGESRFGLAAERNQLEHRVAVVVAGLEHVGFEVRGSAVDVAFRADVRQPRVEGPVAAHQARGDVHGLLVGVVRAVGERRVAAELGLQGVGRHVDRSAEGSRAVGRDAGAALHLNASHGRDEVGGVVPVHRVRVGVVHRHAVDRDVETRRVRAAQAHGRAADADARFVGGDHRGGQGQQCGDVGSVAVAGDLFAPDVGVGHGGVRGCARGGHLDLLQAVHSDRIAGVLVGGLLLFSPQLCGRAERGGRK